jgi:hypothetical protein
MYNKMSDCKWLETENILFQLCNRRRLHIDRVKTNWLPFPSCLQISISIFGHDLLANQITSNVGFISIHLYLYIDIGPVLRQVIVLLNVAGAFYRNNNV